MRLLEIDLLEAVAEALLLSELQGLADALVIGRKAEDARDQGLVRAVAAVCLRERPVQVDVGADRRLAEYLAGHEAEPHGPCRMRARRADHDGPDNVKYTVHKKLLSPISGISKKESPRGSSPEGFDLLKKGSAAVAYLIRPWLRRAVSSCFSCSGSISESGMRSGPAA